MTPQNLSPIRRGQVTKNTCPQHVGDRSGTGFRKKAQMTLSEHENHPFTCPQNVGDRSGTGTPAYLSPVPPSLTGGQGQGQRGTATRFVPNWQRELGAERARAVKPMDCPSCGQPVLVGPDDVPGQSEVVAADPGRITRLGMYQAATTGRRLFTVHSGKQGAYLDWLGDWAIPNPDETHMVAAHDCDQPPAEHHPAPAPSAPTDAPPF